MDYQPMNPQENQPINPPEQLPVNETTSHMKAYILGVVAIVAVGLVIWYFFMAPATPAPTASPTAVEQTAPAPAAAVSGNTTADINADLSQVPSDAGLDQAAAAAAQDLSSF